MSMGRRWLALGPSILAVVVLAGTTAIAFAGSGNSNPPGPSPTASNPPANPAASEPGYPGADPPGQAKHDPNAIGPCGERWGDIYVDDSGLFTVAYGDFSSANPNSNGNGPKCNVLTKAERDRQQQYEKDHPYGAGSTPASQSSPTTSSTTP